ncbi:hypothetical protein M9194_09200 [Vibrio sp. S4M6]|uniref:hypothetical protein n=1 Tax=Vibrio sinus TaxID=2946865 RepID=UPI00202A3116|nr:hypothetical protein [Vibrio sinus]MCL9781601.1 hypothetical protein [Vibrio sinus]
MKPYYQFLVKPNRYIVLWLLFSIGFYLYSYEYFKKENIEVVNGDYISNVHYGPILDSLHKIVDVSFSDNDFHGNIFIKEAGYKYFSQFAISGSLSSYEDGVFQLTTHVVKQQGAEISNIEHASRYRNFDIIDDADVVKRRIDFIYRSGNVIILWNAKFHFYYVLVEK